MRPSANKENKLVKAARMLVSRLPLLVILIALSAACSDGGTNTLQFGSSNDTPIGRGDQGVVHVHGLAINPADNTLYAATHTGLFQIASGQAKRVGGNFQDTMGFTIVGPNLFLGSGHPDYKSYSDGKLPPLLGLIQSGDAGRNWTSISLLGKSDFHALRIAHGLIYGYDSSSEAFMVSKDEGKSWDTRSKLTLFDFAVNPESPDRVLATTAVNLMGSSDRGASWQRMEAPPFVLLAWPEKARLWGLDKNGNVHLSADGGRTWQTQGTVSGFPEAFLDAGTALYVAVREQGLMRSDDLGKTWTLYYRDPV